jgi:four helix bundle protein
MEYENTTIYLRARDLLALSRRVLDGLPPGYGFLADQLRRASSSVLLNFAEGYGKSSKRDARRYFAIARGSANEVAAIFDVAREFGVVGARAHGEGKEVCDHLARMLTRFRR